MSLRLRKSAAAVAVSVMAGLTLVACGAEDDAGASGDTSAVGEDAGTELTQDNFFTEVAAAQQEASTAHVDMDFGVAGQAIKASGDIATAETPADSAMSMSMSMGSMESIEMRLVDQVLYMNMGPMSQNKFFTIDLTDESGPLGGQFNDLLDNIDPAQQLELMQEAITSFEQQGDPEQLDGVEATPYVVTIDSSAAAENLGEEVAGQAELPKELVYTMYVGPDNLPRRITMDIAGTTMTMNYSKWGEDVTIEAPSEDQITDANPMEQLGGV